MSTFLKRVAERHPDIQTSTPARHAAKKGSPAEWIKIWDDLESKKLKKVNLHIKAIGNGPDTNGLSEFTVARRSLKPKVFSGGVHGRVSRTSMTLKQKGESKAHWKLWKEVRENGDIVIKASVGNLAMSLVDMKR